MRYPRLFLPFVRTTHNRIVANGSLVKNSFFAVLGLVIFAALYYLTLRSVSYFHSQNELGVILNVKIMQMAWITIFAMLMFSSMVTGVSTLYLSNDNEIIVSSPVSLAELFRMRLSTTFLNTSWMLMIFSIPIFAAFGTVFEAGPLFLPLLVAVIPATAFTACASATLFVIMLVYLFPARRTKDIIFYLTLCFGLFLYLIFRLMRPEDLVNPEKYGQFIEYMSAVSEPTGSWFPASWTANLLTTYLLDRQVDVLLLVLILLTPAVCLIAGEMLMHRFFMSGFSKSQESFGGTYRFRPPRRFRPRWSWMFTKERISFLRDSKEWSQFFMIGALVVVYLYNFKVLPLERTFGSVYVANLIAFGNIGLSGFLGASLAARFVFPSVGAEGGAFYLIRSSPLTPGRYLLYKYLFYLVPFTLLTLVLICVSNHFLKISGPMWWISLFAATLICWTVVAMALGFGAVFADYHAENKAASMGPGAIFYFFSAVGYMLVVLFTGISPTYRLVRTAFFGRGLPLLDGLVVIAWITGVITLSVIVVAVVGRKAVAALRPH